MRRRLVLMALVSMLTTLATVGCTRFSGPLETRRMSRPDAPGYTIDEQQLRGRERLSISEDDFRIGPKGYIDRVSPTGR